MVSIRSRSLALVALVLFLLAPAAVAQEDRRVSTTFTAAWDGTGTQPANTACTIARPAVGTVAFQLSGTFSATVTFEASVDGTNFIAVGAVDMSDGATVATTATAAGIYRLQTPGAVYTRARCSAFTSGPVVIVGAGSVTPFSPPVSVGDVTVDEVTADTELPDAVSLVTGTAAQTAPFVGAALFGISAANTWNAILTASNLGDGSTGGQSLPAFNWLYNGTGWDRMRGDITNGLDVDVTRLIPGVTATALGKAEDAAHTTGDTGVMALAVRNDTQAALATTDGDYAPLQVGANGSLRVVAAGYTDVITSTLTRPGNTTAYAAGDEVADTSTNVITLTGMTRFSGGTSIIQSVSIAVSSNWATKPSLELWLFDTTNAPATDNAAFDPTDGENDTLVAVIPVSSTYIGDATANTGNFIMDTGQISVPVKTSGSANLFMRVVIRNAGQAGANSDTLKFKFRVLMD